MKVEVKIDNSYKEPKVIIITDTITDEVNLIINKLSEKTPQIILGNKNEKLELIEQSDLIRIYSNSGKVFAVTDKGEYINIKFRLYEIESLLNSTQFVRISNSEIINLKKVKHFDLNFTGTICVELIDDTKTYVSRRYVSKVKKTLGI